MRRGAAKEEVGHELPEIIAADDWSNVGYVALGWVRRSRSHTKAADTNADASPTDTNADASPTDTNADASPTDTNADASPTDINANPSPAHTNADPAPRVCLRVGSGHGAYPLFAGGAILSPD
jgi:hypothetical protein